MWLASPEEWHALGRKLGLTPFVSEGPFVRGTGFPALVRSLHTPAEGASPSFAHWLVGRHHDTDVLVVPFTEGEGHLEKPYVGVVAHIDPPLFVGLRIRAKDYWHGSVGFTSGEADRALAITAWSEDVARRLLAAPNGDAPLDRLAPYAPKVDVSDSAVLLFQRDGATDAADVIRLLDAAWERADEFAALRAALPLDDAERRLAEEWQAVADATGSTFDPLRRLLVAAREGITLALETAGDGLDLVTTIRFPRPIDHETRRLGLARVGAPSLLGRIRGREVVLGGHAFRVTGSSGRDVESLLDRPAIARGLGAIAGRCSELTLDEASVFYRVARSTDADAAFDAARTLLEALFEPTERAPYR